MRQELDHNIRVGRWSTADGNKLIGCIQCKGKSLLLIVKYFQSLRTLGDRGTESG